MVGALATLVKSEFLLSGLLSQMTRRLKFTLLDTLRNIFDFASSFPALLLLMEFRICPKFRR